MSLIRFHRYCFFSASLVFLITALNSHGFYHADEHYQVLEFAMFKEGTNEIKDLAWEFKEKIRSGLMPSIAFLLFSILKFFNLTEPHLQAQILRLLTAAFALYTINKSVQIINQKIVKNKFAQKTIIIISYFLWFIPFLSSRYSAETLSGLLFLWVVLETFKNDISYSKLGLFIGFAFLFRYQIGFAIVPFMIFSLLKIKPKTGSVLKLITSFTIVFLFGVYVDFWFYNEFTLSFWNYFKLVLEGIFSDSENAFGTEGTWFYFIQLIKAPFIPIGCLFVICSIGLFIKDKFNPLIISLIFFIFIHTLIDHKEIRFMFPIAFLMPVIFAQSFSETNIFEYFLCKYKKRFISIILFFLILNLLGIITMASKSAGLGRMEITKYIARNFSKEKVVLHHTNWSNPYDPWQGLKMNFYHRDFIQCHLIDDLCKINDLKVDDNQITNLIVIRNIETNNECLQKHLKHDNITLLKSSIPSWIISLNDYYHGFDDDNVLFLYKIED